MNDEKKNLEITIDETRKTYINQVYDITMIEIKKEDGLNKDSFLEIDKQIFEEDFKEIFMKKNVYLLHYPKGKEMNFTSGIINGIGEDNFTIEHRCDSSEGSSGGPLINSTNFQVIGIHKGGAKGAKMFNLGTLIKEPIENFNEEIKR